MEIEEVISHFIGRMLPSGHSEVSLTDSLFQSGALDSMSLAELVLFLETSFQIRVRPSEVTLENLDSVAQMGGYVRSKKLA
jgi:acyl carrier protein